MSRSDHGPAEGQAPVIDADDVFVLFRSAEELSRRTKSGRDVVVLRGLTMHVGAEEIVAVQGPSGSGKSTFVRAVRSEIPISAGSLHVSAPSMSVLSQRSGAELVPELTCLANARLRFRRNLPDVDPLELLDRFGAAHLAARFPGELSTGEARRVGFACALVDSSPLILADEPTGALDLPARQAVMEALISHVRGAGASMMIVTHDDATADFADRVLTIRDGRVSEERRNRSTSLVVDRRGWLRLPDSERRRSGIDGRAAITPSDEATAVVLRSPAIEAGHDGTATEPGGPPRSPSRPAPSSAIVTATDIEVDVPGTDQRIVGPVSFDVVSGSLTVIAGPSGAGKTTLLGVLAEVIRPTRGHLQKGNGTEVPIDVAVAPSAVALPERSTVRKCLELIAAVRAQRSNSDREDDTDGACSYHELCALLGIEHLLDRVCGELSGGERQRVGVVRAMTGNAALILLDEPTSQLDEANAARMVEALRHLTAQGRTIVAASHDDVLIRSADRVVRLL